MYDIILDSLIDEMHNFGLISTIIISTDYYEKMTNKQINHLESLLDLSGGIKWMLVNDRKEYFAFKYSLEPYSFI